MMANLSEGQLDASSAFTEIVVDYFAFFTVKYTK